MTIQEAITSKKNGLYYGNRLILPFKAEILKIILDDKIITDFSDSTNEIEIRIAENFMDIYFCGYNDLRDRISKYEAIKIIVVDDGKDIFDLANHQKISVYLQDKHSVKIEFNEEDILFIE